MLFVLSFVAIEESLEKVRNNLHLTSSIKPNENETVIYSFPKDEDWEQFKENGGKFI